MMTIYIPMTLWQALCFVRNPGEVLTSRIINPDAKSKGRAPLGGEIPVADRLTGYHCAKHAVEAFRARGGEGEMALVEIIFGERFHEQLAYEGKIRGTDTDELTGQALWVVTPAGCADLVTRARFVMEVVQGEPRPAKAPVIEEFGGGGPLGNGGC